MLTNTETKTVLWFNLKNVHSNKEMHLINVIYLSSWLLAEKTSSQSLDILIILFFSVKWREYCCCATNWLTVWSLNWLKQNHVASKIAAHVDMFLITMLSQSYFHHHRRRGERTIEGGREREEKRRKRDGEKMSGLFLAIPPKMPVWEINLLSSLDRNLTLICLQPNPGPPCHSRFHSNLALSPCIYDTISSYFDYISVEIFKV